MLPLPRQLCSVWFKGKLWRHFPCRFSWFQLSYYDHLMCMLCMFVYFVDALRMSLAVYFLLCVYLCFLANVCFQCRRISVYFINVIKGFTDDDPNLSSVCLRQAYINALEAMLGQQRGEEVLWWTSFGIYEKASCWLDVLQEGPSTLASAPSPMIWNIPSV